MCTASSVIESSELTENNPCKNESRHRSGADSSECAYLEWRQIRLAI
ncbi:hypothetical protein SEA_WILLIAMBOONE_27 [Gordonia phage WilliamBoone]|nr:hypothetical protein SEA_WILLIAMBOONE_27 [Gordonia phage WilliamBoone]